MTDTGGVHRKELEWDGRPLVLETGRVARQADGAVLVTYGRSVVLCTAVAARTPAGRDFFPLTVNYQEKAYAAGKIPGGFFKREGRPSEREVLVSRLIDRPIRPLFPDSFRNEIQVIATVLAYDQDNPADIPAIIGSSAALCLSGLPFRGPVAAARVGYADGSYLLNPPIGEAGESELDLVVAGTGDAVLMVESEARELSEDIMLGAVMFGHRAFQPVISAVRELARAAGKRPVETGAGGTDAGLAARVAELCREDIATAYQRTVKQERQEALATIRERVHETLARTSPDISPDLVRGALEALEAQVVRSAILGTGKRIDGRGLRDIRPITCEVGVLPRTHGSALFTRGETQAMVVTTLGTGQDEQIVDALQGEYRENFMLHYNFPPYSVGETGRTGSPGRREIGHGKLAWRALHPLLPQKASFPYTVRVVSEITESNGSSSMASVCGASLSLMDAGVPLRGPCSGIAMGLVLEGDRHAVLSDILGDEDYLGDMDFKVAGTSEGITALQMDIKISGITGEIMQEALAQAREGRLHILACMREIIADPRQGTRSGVPQIRMITIPRDRIRDVIGTGGKIIREICEKTGARVDVEDDGTVRVAAAEQTAMQAALDWIRSITSDPEVGAVYNGRVVKIADYGAFVNFFGARDGLVHISELAPHRVARTTDIVQEGDVVRVQVLDIDGNGRIRLSMKAVSGKTGA